MDSCHGNPCSKKKEGRLEEEYKHPNSFLTFTTPFVCLFSHQVFITIFTIYFLFPRSLFSFMLWISEPFNYSILSFCPLRFTVPHLRFVFFIIILVLSLFSLFFPRRILSLIPRIWCGSIPNIFFFSFRIFFFSQSHHPHCFLHRTRFPCPFVCFFPRLCLFP